MTTGVAPPPGAGWLAPGCWTKRGPRCWTAGRRANPPCGIVLTLALDGTEALPCSISEARRAAVAGSTAPIGRNAACAADGPAPAPAARGGLTNGRAGLTEPGGGRRLMTLLITVVLWMLAKMMSFGGGRTYTGGRT